MESPFIKLLTSSLLFIFLTGCACAQDTFQAATPSQRTDVFNPSLPPMGLSDDKGKSYELFNGGGGNNTISLQKKWDLGG